MNRENTKNAIAFMVLFSVVSLLFAGSAAAMGLSPSRITIDSALKGETYQQSLRVFNLEDSPVVVEFNVTDNFTGWATFYNADDLETPITSGEIPGNGDSFFLMKIHIPEDTPNGEYTGDLVVKTAAGSYTGTETGSSVSHGIKSRMRITVTGDELLSGEVLGITIFDAEVNRETRVRLQFKNTGNVKENPVLKADIKREGSSIDSFEFTGPDFQVGELKSVDFSWDTTGNPPGEYTADVRVYLKDIMIHEEEINFTIFERGALTAFAELMEVSATENVAPGGTARIYARIWNRGDIDITAVLKAEVYFNGELVDVIESDDVYVNKDHFGELIAYYKPETAGVYTLKPEVVFEGKKITLDPVTINAGSGTGLTGQVAGTGLEIAVPVMILIIVIAGVVLVARGRSQPAWKKYSGA